MQVAKVDQVSVNWNKLCYDHLLCWKSRLLILTHVFTGNRLFMITWWGSSLDKTSTIQASISRIVVSTNAHRHAGDDFTLLSQQWGCVSYVITHLNAARDLWINTSIKSKLQSSWSPFFQAVSKPLQWPRFGKVCISCGLQSECPVGCRRPRQINRVVSGCTRLPANRQHWQTIIPPLRLSEMDIWIGEGIRWRGSYTRLCACDSNCHWFLFIWSDFRRLCAPSKGSIIWNKTFAPREMFSLIRGRSYASSFTIYLHRIHGPLNWEKWILPKYICRLFSHGEIPISDELAKRN